MTRRSWTLGAISGFVAGPAIASDAWKKKKNSQWSKEDAATILNHSPWARAGKVEFKLQGQDMEGPRSGGVIGPPTGPPGGNGTIGPPGGGPARSGGGMVQNGPGALPEFRALVRWDSALPVRQAEGLDAAGGTPNQYVLSVIGFPVLRTDVAGALVTMRRTARLERAGRDWIRPTRVESRQAGNSVDLVFTFDSEPQPITAGDKEVVFVTILGVMNLRVRFILKEMIYEHELAL